MNWRSINQQVQLIWDPWNPPTKKLTKYWWCMPSTASFIQLCLHETPSWKIFKEHPGLLKNLGICDPTEETIHQVFRTETFVSRIYYMCREPTLSMQHGSYCSPRQGNQFKQRPQQVMGSVFTWREYTIKRWYGDMPTAPHLSSLRPQKLDGDLGNQDCSPYWWNWVPYQAVASRWSHVRVANNAILVAAHDRNQDCDAHQSVHASIRLIIRRPAWIGIHEDWLWWLKAVHTGGPIPSKSPKLWFGSHFVYANLMVKKSNIAWEGG